MIAHGPQADGRVLYRSSSMSRSGERSPRPGLHAVLLAGVHAWGGYLLDEVICRPLVPIAGRPLIAHICRWLREYGIAKASLCANSDTVHLRNALGDGEGVGIELDYYEDVMPRGPAGSVRDAARLCPADLYVVVGGTLLPRIDLAEVVARHRDSGAVLTVVATRGNGHGPGRDADLHPAGLYVFSPEALESIPANGYQDIKEGLVPTLHAEGKRVVAHVVGDEMIGQVAGTRSYMSVSQWAVEQMTGESKVPAGYARAGEALVHKTARVDATARLIGPVIVEPGARIGVEALIVGPTVIGAGCFVGSRAVISRSTLWSSCRVDRDAILDDCLLTDQSVIEEGLVIRSAVCAWPQRRGIGLARNREDVGALASKTPVPTVSSVACPPRVAQGGRGKARIGALPRAARRAGSSTRELVHSRKGDEG